MGLSLKSYNEIQNWHQFKAVTIGAHSDLPVIKTLTSGLFRVKRPWFIDYNLPDAILTQAKVHYNLNSFTLAFKIRTHTDVIHS